MAKMWVQLKTAKHLETRGKLKTYQAGDWVAVGKQTALLWISEGSAWVPEGKAADLMGADCGVFLISPQRHKDTKAQRIEKEALGDYVGKIEIQAGTWPESLPWSKTLLYNPALRLRKELVPVGFHLLDTWQVAVPLWDYEKLAADQGTAEDRERTAAVIRDLRVPLYSPDLVFLRRCPDVERFVADWAADSEGDARFSLLRAIYRCKPLILALPTTWIGKDRGL